MSAYLIVQVQVTDPQQYAKYTAVTPALLQQFGGRFIVRGGPVEALEGTHDGRRVVVIEFPSVEQARTFWRSPAYAEAKKLRAEAAVVTAIVIPGA
ncbi:MAG TPA: DUF1330 domain-containing protein [Vicinamibacterales bacterium]|nr:DUF1330 domain-containing protein [Vicinamibacterales bacterium]